MLQENIREIVEHFSTPAYIFDVEILLKRIKSVKEILGNDISLCYAMKANPWMISYINGVIDKFEVCSPGEYEICMSEKLPTDKIVLSGVYKNKDDIEKTVKNGFTGLYTIESVTQLKVLKEVYKDQSAKPEFIIRLTNGSQFGMDKKTIRGLFETEIIKDIGKCVGIHYFSGTQKKNLSELKKELEEVVLFCRELKKAYHVELRTIEYGPGLFIDYFNENADEDTEAVIALANMLEEYKSEFHFTIELGRYLAATCGTYLTKVVDIKSNDGVNYAIVDGGIHQISYYGQMLGIKIPPFKRILCSNEEEEDDKEWTVCGSLCTMRDVVLRKTRGKINLGDLLAFEKCGAYSVTEGEALFLSRNLPIILVRESDGTIRILRETFETYRLNCVWRREYSNEVC